MSAMSRVVRISDINFNIPPAEVEDEVRRIFSRDFDGFDIAVVKPRVKKTRLVFLTFQSIRDAERAVKMHERLKLFGELVRVAFDMSKRKQPGNRSSPTMPNFNPKVNDLLQKAKSLISHYNDEGVSSSRGKSGRRSDSKDLVFPNISNTRMPPSQTLFIGKLDKTVRKKDIETALSRFGLIESIMIYNHNPHRVFAFVKFFNLFMARKALKSMVGRRFLHCDCLFGYGQTAATNILWIGGIGPWIDIILLKKKFEEFGEVKNVEWPPDKNFAYIEFDSIRSARRALEKMRGTVLGKRRINLDYSDRSQMTSNINYSDTYLGGDSDSEDEVVTTKPSRCSAAQFDYDSYNREVDVFFDEIYRDHPEHFEHRSLERSPPRVDRKYEPERPTAGRRASPSPRPPQSRREGFDWKNGKYDDDFYAPMDRDFPDRRSPGFDVGLKCTIKNDLYHGRRSPEKPRERHHMEDYSETRKRKEYEDHPVSSLPYKKYRSRSRSRERHSRGPVIDKFSKDNFYSRESPSDFSERGHGKGYKESFGFRQSPTLKSSMEETYMRSKFDEIPHISQEASMNYSHQKPPAYESSQNFSMRRGTPEPRVSHDKWYSNEQYPSERSVFDISPHGARHSPARFTYKGPTPHAVQMTSGYEAEMVSRNMQNTESELLRKYPSVWTGCLTFKNKCYWTSMSLISGSIPLVNALLNDSLPLDMKLLKITQRLRLDMPEKLVELERRVDMAGRNGSSILLAFPAANIKSAMPGYECLPLVKLSNFLKETQLAAVVLLPTERPYSSDKGILHIFPRCQFSINFLQREAPELTNYFEAGDNLLMIVVKDMSQ